MTIDHMEMGSIIEFLENNTILVTGATGFLAKIFVEKILRVQPNIKKLFLLIRASDLDSVQYRLEKEIIEKDLFRIIKEKYGKNLHTFISEKITPVAGDITCENFGVANHDLLNEMWREVDIVINSAATTNFDERYDVALEINTLGVKHVCSFANKCSRMKLLLHVSTAYVSGENPGIILETPFKLGKTLDGKNGLDINFEKKITDELRKQLAAKKANSEAILSTMKDFGIQRTNLHGWPNTYVFTKAMGEMLLQEELRQDVPCIILRPTIISSTYKEPFPGWIEGIKTIDSFSAAYGKGRTSCFLADPNIVVDVIPADMVVNAMIVAMVAHANQHYSKTIYHIGSSASNPMKISSLKNYNLDYFSKHPLKNKYGKPIIVANKISMLSSMSSFNRYMEIRYMLPLTVLKFANIILCRALDGMYMDAKRRIEITVRLAKLFKAYVMIDKIYDDTNLNRLYVIARESANVDTEIFFFNPKCINWEEYFMNTHFPGLVKYALKY